MRRIDPQLEMKKLALVHERTLAAEVKAGNPYALHVAWFTANNRIMGDFELDFSYFYMPKRGLDKLHAFVDSLGGKY